MQNKLKLVDLETTYISFSKTRTYARENWIEGKEKKKKKSISRENDILLQMEYLN